MQYKGMYIPDSYFDNRILHVDLNKFYASVFLLYHPQYKGRPVAVLGSQEDRSGIVLTATKEAKDRGIKTGMVYWQAEQLVPDVLFVPPDYKAYQHFSRVFRDIYAQYTDRVEPFGLDESWLDVTHTQHLFGGALQIARDINRIAREEIGLTVSIGVSFNKTIAKLGSDMKKPDAITVLEPETWQERAYPLPVEELLYVGHRTQPKLNAMGIYTIGQLAEMPVWVLENRFGKVGTYLWMFANGLDQTPVAEKDAEPYIKSVGNSQTAPFDLKTDNEVLVLYTILGESVAARLRDAGFMCRGVEISLRDKNLKRITRQMHLAQPTCVAQEIIRAAMQLYHKHKWGVPMRSVGVRGIDLVGMDTPYQVSLDCDAEKHERMVRLEETKDDIRYRFGNKKIVSAREMTNNAISHFDIKKENVVHPVGYLRNDGA